MLWYTGSNIEITWEIIIQKCAYHHSQGGRFYVGCDSHIHANKCSYVEAICLHGANGQQGGSYFYRRENSILQKKVVLRCLFYCDFLLPRIVNKRYGLRNIINYI